MTRWHPRRLRPVRRGTPVVCALAAVALAGACATVDVPESLPGPTTTTTEAPQPAPEAQDPACTDGVDGNVVESLRPDAAAEQALATRSYPAGSTMADIQARGRLRVGVDASTNLFSSVDPLTGDFVGFDVDVAREMARALLGDPEAIEFVAITADQRIDALTADDPVVDMVVRTFTINCVREDDIDFSSQYFTSTQKLLVRTDSPVDDIGDLGEDDTVCAPAGSTSIARLADLPEPRPAALGVAENSECLVRLHQGQVQGISTDDTILAGMAAQDPNVHIVGEPLGDEPYGIGLPPGDPEFVRLVNAALEQMRSSGRWVEIYDEHLAGVLPSATGGEPPPARYQD
jgi:polar amino acid transport system substrate-binding protein